MKKPIIFYTIIFTMLIISCYPASNSSIHKKTLELENNNSVSTIFRDSLFTKKQINFIINELKKQLSPNDTNLHLNSSIGETINLWMSGEEGYRVEIVFNPFYDPNFSVDFDKDGNKEIIFIVDETAGGTAQWNTIYCLKEKKDASLALVLLKYPCPCSKPFYCQDSPNLSLINVVNNNLIIEIGCLNKNDADCCPSLYYEVKYKYENDMLIQISKKIKKE